MVSKLFEMGIFSEEKNKDAALGYLSSFMEEGKKNILFFSTEDCIACTEELSGLKADKNFSDANLIHIYHQKEALLQQEENEILDRQRILGRIFHVMGYPSVYLQSETDGTFYPLD